MNTLCSTFSLDEFKSMIGTYVALWCICGLSAGVVCVAAESVRPALLLLYLCCPPPPVYSHLHIHVCARTHACSLQVRRAARDELRKGAHCIKVMASGGVASPTDK